MPVDTAVQASPCKSVYEEAQKEADCHKWIESQKRGRDLGETALKEWYCLHWPAYCRKRRLEHLKGRRRWREFGDDNFGQLFDLILEGDLLVDRILDRVDAGWENLEIINWSLDWGLPMPRVLDLLVQVDVNRARLEPRSGTDSAAAR
jgi:hypothetical protein